MFRSDMQVHLLALLLLQPERPWTIEEIARALDAPSSSVVRELLRAESAGLVVRDASRRPHRLTAAVASPLYQPLHDLLERTVGVETDLRDALAVQGVDVAAIHGSWANPPRRPDSDIDVVVVGDASLRELRRRVRDAGARAGRSVDLTLFTAAELRDRHAKGSGFIRRLLEQPVIPLIGDLGEVLAE